MEFSLGLRLGAVDGMVSRSRPGGHGSRTNGCHTCAIGTIAVVWVVFICIMLMMPQLSPGGLGLKLIDSLN